MNVLRGSCIFEQMCRIYGVVEDDHDGVYADLVHNYTDSYGEWPVKYGETLMRKVLDWLNEHLGSVSSVVRMRFLINAIFSLILDTW